ncbi:hypothetical protein FAIPA1_20374 [Frankia sp. AiPs1]
MPAGPTLPTALPAGPPLVLLVLVLRRRIMPARARPAPARPMREARPGGPDSSHAGCGSCGRHRGLVTRAGRGQAATNPIGTSRRLAGRMRPRPRSGPRSTSRWRCVSRPAGPGG